MNAGASARDAARASSTPTHVAPAHAGLLRSIASWVATAALCAAAALADASAARASEAGSLTNQADYSELNLSADFIRKLRDHAVLDVYSARFHAVETEAPPGIVDPLPPAPSRAHSIRVVRPETPEPILTYRLALKDLMRPVRSYRAPILQHKTDLRQARSPTPVPTQAQQQASDLIRTRLAYDGLLATLAQAIEILGPKTFLTNAASGLAQLRDLGFPDDLLAFFPFPTASDPATTAHQIALRLNAGASARSLASSLQAVPFDFHPAMPGFVVADETGREPIGLVRLQIGGGYDNGIVRGGMIDVAQQLVRDLPRANFLISVEDDYFDNILAIALNHWHLRRPNSLVLVRQVGPVQPWSQDNAKAGVRPLRSGALSPATLVPRYASQEEVNARMIAGDSFLMDGLDAAGFQVGQTPLLFQGGNVLGVHDPSSSRHLLLLSETELYRNRTCGLTWDQAREAFRREFGVDACVVIPSVSYHLDFDVTLRTHHGQLIAFVNDMTAAAHLIVRRGIEALEQGKLLSKDVADRARSDLSEGHTDRLLPVLDQTCRPFLNEKSQYRPALVNLFSAAPTDPAAFNFQCFLAAIDILASDLSSERKDQAPTLRDSYLAALRNVRADLQAQAQAFTQMGCKVVPVPSLPDLHHSMNFLNGLHDPSHFYMPALGGFYTSLDDAAAAAFQQVLGPDISIVRIANPAAQKSHGGLHCVAAVYPNAASTPGPQ